MKRYLLLALPAFFACTVHIKHGENTDEKEIRKINDDYTSAWLKGDEKGVLSLFEEGARIQPSSLCPIDSLPNIKAFWFPADGSVTTIDRFTNDISYLKIDSSIAYATHESILDWSYQKDTSRMKVAQKGIATTLYRKQPDGHWKIWRQMWSDIYAHRR